MNQSIRTLAWSQRIAAIAIVLFWLSFWHDHQQLPANVVDFEWCFLVPDLLWISGAFLLASRWLLTGSPKAAMGAAVGGSAMVYLGLLDAACNLRHGQYTESVSRGVLNIIVNLACVLFGGFNIAWAMKRDAARPVN